MLTAGYFELKSTPGKTLNHNIHFGEYSSKNTTQFKLQEQSSELMNFKAGSNWMVQLTCFSASVLLSFTCTSTWLFRFLFQECSHFEKSL